MQDKKPHKQLSASQFANSLIVDMKSLSNILKPLSKNLYQNNNRILNQLLTTRDDELFSMIIKLLTHTLQIAHYKVLITQVLSIMNKSLICIKTIQNVQVSQSARQSISHILNSMVDILVAVSTQHRQSQDTSLRVLQITFSLIDGILIPYYQYSMITKIFSICFQFCNVPSLMQNISVSALCALVQALFQFGRIQQSFQLLDSFLKYLFADKKFIWIKGKQIKGLIWDLIIICVKNFTANHIISLEHHKDCLQLIQKMYDAVSQKIFQKKNRGMYNLPSLETSNNNIKNPPQPILNISDFTRYFKVYVAFSSLLSIEAYRIIDREYVPFRATIPKLSMISDLQRNSRMFIFLQAICRLLLDQYDMPLSLDKGSIFMQILSKIGQQLCWSNQTGVKVNWQHNQNYLEKVINQEPKISDGDFVRLVKNTIVQLRIKFEKDQDLINCKKLKRQQMNSSRSSKQLSTLPENLRNSKKWEMFMKNVIRVIRYLSSLNFINDQNEQDPTRKIILELQYWFLICPASKAKNMVLQQLLITANVLNNRMQAIKVSQSVQIGSNILYGYYQDLDSMGLTIILKMMAGIKADWEEGKSFEELDEIYNLCSNVFSQQKLIKNQASFIMTIQALVQCISSLIADIEQPKQKTQNNQTNVKRCHKMIEFLIQRLIVVMKNNLTQSALEWNFITGFLITLCINKNVKIKEQGIKAIGNLVNNLLKTQLGQQLQIKKEVDILSLYEQLAKSKLQVKQVELMLIDQLKLIMPRIKQQAALIDGFRIVKILSQMQFQGHQTLTQSQIASQVTASKKNNVQVMGSIHQLQQILIKQCIFKITQIKYLKMILQGMQIKFSQKNQQYRLINLLWSIADHFRKITPKVDIPNEYLQLWQILFKSIWVICQTTNQCETKQSAIHSITQILAEVLGLLPFDFVIIIISKYYHQMVLLLLGIHLQNNENNSNLNSSSILNDEKSPQTAKIALKNFIKLYKKLISIQDKNQENKKQIINNLSDINQKITKFIRSHSHKDNKNTGNLTLQFLYQLLNYILLVNDDKGFQQYGIKKHLRELYVAIEDIVKFAEQLSSNTNGNNANVTKMDLKSHMFRKKLKPLLDKIKQAQESQQKQPIKQQKPTENTNSENKNTENPSVDQAKSGMNNS